MLKSIDRHSTIDRQTSSAPLRKQFLAVGGVLPGHWPLRITTPGSGLTDCGAFFWAERRWDANQQQYSTSMRTCARGGFSSQAHVRTAGGGPVLGGGRYAGSGGVHARRPPGRQASAPTRSRAPDIPCPSLLVSASRAHASCRDPRPLPRGQKAAARWILLWRARCLPPPAALTCTSYRKA